MIQESNTISLSMPTNDGRHECLLCPHHCKLREGQNGMCMARGSDGSGVKLLAYGKMTQMAVEPIEKKPIWHYKPGTKTLSLGSFGCSMVCDFCQNFMVSQRNRAHDAKFQSPEDVIKIAQEKNCTAICFTYNEPTIYYEYVCDVKNALEGTNIDLILKTNAYAEIEPWKNICSITDAMNIDFKGTNERYKEVAGADDSVIYQNIELAVSSKCHVEISVPVYHDSSIKEYSKIRDFLTKINPSIPIHLLKIFPANKTNIYPVTSDGLLLKVQKFMKESLRFVYIANIFTNSVSRSTVCHGCNSLLVDRTESDINIVSVKKCCGDCPVMY